MQGLNDFNQPLNDEHRGAALRAIDLIIFASSGARLAEICPALRPPQLVVAAGNNFLIKEELRYDKPAMAAKAARNLGMMNPAQHAATTAILTAVASPATEVITLRCSSRCSTMFTICSLYAIFYNDLTITVRRQRFSSWTAPVGLGRLSCGKPFWPLCGVTGRLPWRWPPAVLLACC